jgi:hypothetical protein
LLPPQQSRIEETSGGPREYIHLLVRLVVGAIFLSVGTVRTINISSLSTTESRRGNEGKRPVPASGESPSKTTGTGFPFGHELFRKPT